MVVPTPEKAEVGKADTPPYGVTVAGTLEVTPVKPPLTPVTPLVNPETPVDRAASSYGQGIRCCCSCPEVYSKTLSFSLKI